MEKHYYVIVSDDFAKKYEGYQKDNQVINFVLLKDGSAFVTSANALNVFPEIFEDKPEIESLTEDAFPDPPEKK